MGPKFQSRFQMRKKATYSTEEKAHLETEESKQALKIPLSALML